jgi:GNAT superfamily N-acetyltransferase
VREDRIVPRVEEGRISTQHRPWQAESRVIHSFLKGSYWATFAYLADVLFFEEHRGRGLGKWLMEVVLSHPDLQVINYLRPASGETLVARKAALRHPSRAFRPPC